MDFRVSPDAPLAPGHWEGATWIATDVSGEAANIQAVATALWTAPVIAAFKAAFPAEPASP